MVWVLLLNTFLLKQLQLGKIIRQEALSAELTRTMLDTLNHLLLYITNKFQLRSVPNLRKGIFLIPPILFMSSGVTTLYELSKVLGKGGTVAGELPGLSLIPIAVV